MKMARTSLIYNSRHYSALVGQRWQRDRHAHLKVNNFLASLLFDLTRECLYVANSGLREIPKPHRVNDAYYFVFI